MTEASPSGGTAATAGGHLPRIVAEVHEDGTGFLAVEGMRQDIVGDDMDQVGQQITTRIAALAAKVGTPLPAEVRDPDGLWVLLVHPDGHVGEAPAAVAGQPPRPTPADAGAGRGTSATSSAAPAASSAATSWATGLAAAPRPAPAHSAPTPAVPIPTAGPTSGFSAGSTTRSASGPATGASPEDSSEAPAGAALGELLATRHRPRRQIATRGWRVGLRRATFGAVKPGPGRKERADRAAVESVRRPLDGPRTIVVINPKGGAHKTTATLLLAAGFGQQRGGYTLAWDNNETHGTLGWRSGTTASGRSALDLLHALPDLSTRGQIRVGDLDAYVRTRTEEQFDVLASDEDVASGAFVDAASFAALHQVLTRFYRVLVVDTGNNIRSSNWRAAVDAADQLVIVSTVREDTAQAAAWAVDALRAAGKSETVRRAVTILSEPSASVDKDLRKRLRQHFGVLTRSVVEVPFDPALVAGGPIEYGRLKPATRDAWLHATGVVAEGL
ncbi:MAG: chromosome partitioning protein [Actinobacteria bacterium]|nr:chromosome partitioning protein [Actinomycetota bacterium]